MSSTTVTPTPAEPSLEQLRQDAVTASTPPVAPPPGQPTQAAPPPAAAAPAPSPTPSSLALPYEVKSADGGNYEVTIRGQVYKGTHQQVIDALAQAQYRATDHISELNGKLEQLTPTARPPVVPTVQPPVESPEVVAARAYLLDEIAKGMGLQNGEALKASFGTMSNVVENTTQESLIAGFYNAVPDFPDSDPANADKLLNFMDTVGIPLTVDGLKAAHYALVAQGAYKPLTPEEVQAQRAKALGLPLPAPAIPTPPGMIPTGAAASQAAQPGTDLETMPLEKLRELALRGGQ